MTVPGTKLSQIPLSSTNPVSTSTFVAFDSANPSTDVRYTFAEMKNVFPTIFANNVNLYIRTPPVVCTISSANPCQVQTLSGTAGQPGGSPIAHGLAINDQIALSIIRTWFTCSVDTSGTNLFTASAAHGFNVNDPVQLIADVAGGTYATGFSTNTTYFVIASGLTATNFRLSATVGGASLTITGTQSGQLYYYRTGTIPSPVIEGYSGYFVVSIPSPSTFTFSTTLGGAPVSTLGHAQAGYFVVQTGNNANDGASATYGHAFMDIQHGADVISNSFENGGVNFVFPVQINVSPGTYFEAVGLGSIQGSFGPDSFGVSALIVGSDAHPENYRVDGGGSPAFRLGGSSNWFIDGFYLLSSFGGTNGPAGLVTCQFDGIAQCSSIYWGLNNPGGWAVSSTNDDNSNGRVFCIGTHKVVDVQANGMIKCDKDSWVEFSHGNFYMMVPVSWGTAFAEISRGAFLFLRADDMNWHNSGSLFFSGNTLLIAGQGRGVSTNPLGNFPGDAQAHFSDQSGWFYDGVRNWQVAAASYTFANLPTLPVEGMIYTVSNSGQASGPITTTGSNHVLSVYLASTNQWYAISPTGGSGSPGTPVGSIQYDNSGAFGGIPKFAYDSTTHNETILSSGANAYSNYYQIGLTGTDNIYCAAGMDNTTAGGHPDSVYFGTSAANVGVATRSVVIGPNLTLNASPLSSILIGHEFNFSAYATQVAIGMAGQTIPTLWVAANNLSLGAASGHYGTVSGSQNISVGFSALVSITSGNNNIVMGAGAASSATGASNNILIGTNAGGAVGQGITTETANVAIGTNVLGGATLGYGGLNEVYIGNQSGFGVVSSGGGNLGVGASTLNQLNGGSNNFAAGFSALAGVLAGSNNMAVGPQALTALTTGASNCAVGINSLSLCTTGGDNVGIGTSAGRGIVTLGGSVSIGSHAMGACGDVDNCVAIGNTAIQLVTGEKNVAIGSFTGAALSSGNNNLLLGYGCSPTSLTTGSQNTLIGANINGATASIGGQNPTLLVAIAGGDGVLKMWVDDGNLFGNTAIGWKAGNYATQAANGGVQNVSVGNQAGAALTTGFSNCCVGVLAGGALTTGHDNTFVGSYDTVHFPNSGAGASVTTGSNNTIVGNYPGSTTMASQVILADGAQNIAVQYDMPNKVHQDMTTTVGALPAAGSAGRRAFVTNSNQTMAANVGAVVTSGGANVVPVFDDGTNWRLG